MKSLAGRKSFWDPQEASGIKAFGRFVVENVPEPDPYTAHPVDDRTVDFHDANTGEPIFRGELSRSPRLARTEEEWRWKWHPHMVEQYPNLETHGTLATSYTAHPRIANFFVETLRNHHRAFARKGFSEGYDEDHPLEWQRPVDDPDTYHLVHRDTREPLMSARRTLYNPSVWTLHWHPNIQSRVSEPVDFDSPIAPAESMDRLKRYGNALYLQHARSGFAHVNWLRDVEKRAAARVKKVEESEDEPIVADRKPGEQHVTWKHRDTNEPFFTSTYNPVILGSVKGRSYHTLRWHENAKNHDPNIDPKEPLIRVDDLDEVGSWANHFYRDRARNGWGKKGLGEAHEKDLDSLDYTRSPEGEYTWHARDTGEPFFRSKLKDYGPRSSAHTLYWHPNVRETRVPNLDVEEPIHTDRNFVNIKDWAEHLYKMHSRDGWRHDRSGFGMKMVKEDTQPSVSESEDEEHELKLVKGRRPRTFEYVHKKTGEPFFTGKALLRHYEVRWHPNVLNYDPSVDLEDPVYKGGGRDMHSTVDSLYKKSARGGWKDVWKKLREEDVQENRNEVDDGTGLKYGWEAETDGVLYRDHATGEPVFIKRSKDSPSGEEEHRVYWHPYQKVNAANLDTELPLHKTHSLWDAKQTAGEIYRKAQRSGWKDVRRGLDEANWNEHPDDPLRMRKTGEGQYEWYHKETGEPFFQSFFGDRSQRSNPHLVPLDLHWHEHAKSYDPTLDVDVPVHTSDNYKDLHWHANENYRRAARRGWKSEDVQESERWDYKHHLEMDNGLDGVFTFSHKETGEPFFTARAHDRRSRLYHLHWHENARNYDPSIDPSVPISGGPYVGTLLSDADHLYQRRARNGWKSETNESVGYDLGESYLGDKPHDLEYHQTGDDSFEYRHKETGEPFFAGKIDKVPEGELGSSWYFAKWHPNVKNHNPEIDTDEYLFKDYSRRSLDRKANHWYRHSARRGFPLREQEEEKELEARPAVGAGSYDFVHRETGEPFFVSHKVHHPEVSFDTHQLYWHPNVRNYNPEVDLTKMVDSSMYQDRLLSYADQVYKAQARRGWHDLHPTHRKPKGYDLGESEEEDGPIVAIGDGENLEWVHRDTGEPFFRSMLKMPPKGRLDTPQHRLFWHENVKAQHDHVDTDHLLYTSSSLSGVRHWANRIWHMHARSGFEPSIWTSKQKAKEAADPGFYNRTGNSLKENADDEWQLKRVRQANGDTHLVHKHTEEPFFVMKRQNLGAIGHRTVLYWHPNAKNYKPHFDTESLLTFSDNDDYVQDRAEDLYRPQARRGWE